MSNSRNRLTNVLSGEDNVEQKETKESFTLTQILTFVFGTRRSEDTGQRGVLLLLVLDFLQQIEQIVPDVTNVELNVLRVR